VDFLVTPTLSIFPPHLEDGDDLLVSRFTLPVNLAGVPALSLPVPTGGPLPASMQLIGPAHSEERLLVAGAFLEAALGVTAIPVRAGGLTCPGPSGGGRVPRP
jgi:Asp-tRNA(Asn)/Glu-tRNA(Gln) amidotransferase A subunit family amidase